MFRMNSRLACREKIAVIGIALYLGLVLAGCATTRTIAQTPESSARPEGEGEAEARSELSAHPEDSKALEKEITSADAEIEPEPHSEVPLEINAGVQKWIDYFSLKDRGRFSKFLERGLRYKDLVQGILKEGGVPREMYYLAMIESGYVTYARSPARAVGAWQFMRATGRRYGLKTNFYLDERKDIVRATRAAARYLKDLHDHFGSWYLALAAYNAGEGRIMRAIRKGRSRDFWALVKKRALPRETMNYVPKFLAAVIIGRNLEKYGFGSIPKNQFPTLKAVAVPASVQLSEVARVAQIPLDELREYNPHLIREITPQDLASYAVWIPEARAGEVESSAQSLVKYTGNSRSLKPMRHAGLPEESRTDLTVHRVRRGDTLISIARRYRISVPELKRLNGLAHHRIVRGQKLRVRARE